MGILTKNRTRISPQEAQRRMQASDAFVLLDVRTAPEYREVRIDGAKLIPVDELALRAPAELPDKQTPIFIYCHSGARAANAADLLVGMGYADVCHFGGVINWPYEVTKG